MYLLCDHLHRSWKPRRCLEDVRSLIPITFPTKLKPVFLTSAAEVEELPTVNLTGESSWSIKHLLSLFIQERENLGELIEGAKLT